MPDSLPQPTRASPLERIVRPALWTLWKAQQVVGLFAVVLCLYVLVASGALRDDNPNCLAVDADEETPLPRFYAVNRFLLRDFPARSVVVETANGVNTLMRAFAIGFVDTANLMVRHLRSPSFVAGISSPAS